MGRKQKFNIVDGHLHDGKVKIKIDNIRVIEKHSDEGANVTVYKAFDTMLNREVALKISCRIDKNVRARTIKAKGECSKIGRLNHPKIATVHYANIIKSYPVAIESFLNGVTLYEWLKTSRTFSQRNLVWHQISDALEYCYNLGVTHGDLHLKNIMINGKDVSIFDFGTSVFAKKHPHSHERAAEQLLKLCDQLFPELPLSGLIQKKGISDPEVIREATDYFLDFIDVKSKFIGFNVNKYIDLRDYIMEMNYFGLWLVELPVFIFEQTEKWIKELPWPSSSLAKDGLNEFYGILYYHSKAKLEEAISGTESSSISSVPITNRKKAKEKYTEWSEYYFENNQKKRR